MPIIRTPKIAQLENLCAERKVHALLINGFQSDELSEVAKHLVKVALQREPKEVDSDVLILRPNENRNISIQQIKSGVKHLSIKPLNSSVKILVILDADCMNKEAANALLISLEEPSANTLLILTSRQAYNLLPTVRSRCVIVKLGSASEQQIRKFLNEEIIDLESGQADEIVRLSLGMPNRAYRLARDKKYFSNIKKIWSDIDQWKRGDFNQRLKLIKTYAKDKPTAQIWLNELAQAKDFSPKAALLAAQRRLNANVSAKSVLEALAMVD